MTNHRNPLSRRRFMQGALVAGASVATIGGAAACATNQDQADSQETPDIAMPQGSTAATPPTPLHYRPERDVAGDAHPYYHEGVWYLYYLNQNFNVRLLTSTDLLHWEPVTLSHTPPGKGTPPHTPYYVLGVLWDEESGVFRSWHGGQSNQMIPNQSTDLINWDFAPESYTVAAQPEYSQQRDPYVFWNEDEGQYWVIMTSLLKDMPNEKNGAISFASSPDMQNWTPRGNLYYPGDIGSPEVPQMFKLGDYWYLFASLYANGRVGRGSYWFSKSPTGPWQQAIPDSVDGDDFSAPNYGFDGERWLGWGWFPLTDRETHGSYTWGGHFAFPRELYQMDDGVLGVRLPAEIGSAIRGELIAPVESATFVPESGEWAATAEGFRFAGDGYGKSTLADPVERIDAEMTLRVGSGTEFAGFLLNSPVGSSGAEVVVDITKSRLVARNDTERGEGTVFAELPLPALDEALSLRLIVEEDMAELFVNDRYALAVRLPLKMGGMTVSLVAKGGSADFDNVAVYSLKGLNEIE